MALEKIRETTPPRGLGRAFFRAPIGLYRLGLGALLGSRFLLLTHTGRKSGLDRLAVLEVMGRDSDRDVWIVSSGYGERADWYRNLRANPRARIQIGGRTVPVEAHPLEPAEAEEVLLAYADRHPRAARSVARVLGYSIDGSEADLRALARLTPMLALARVATA